METIFSKIITGEIPSNKVYEDDTTIAFLDIRPTTPGHTLVIPKNTTPTDIFDISPEDWACVCETARKVAIAIQKGLNADGMHIAMNNRPDGGQVVFHPHVHLIPRFKGDGLKNWPPGTYKEGEANEVREKIISALGV